MSYGTPPPEGDQPQAEPGPGPSSDAKSFFGALFDFSFTHFATTSIVRIVYVLAVVAAVLTWLGFSLVTLVQSPGLGLVFLIAGAIGTLFWLAFIRLTLEFYVAVVRMSEDVHRRLPQS